MTDQVTVALATIPEREATLHSVLLALRVQADVLCCYLNGWSETPAYVDRLADVVVRDPNRSGASRKFHWAGSCSGAYVTCDDDICYPPDYVEVMAGWVRHWKGRAVVTAHGRTYRGSPKDWNDYSDRAVFPRHEEGRWINYPGTGVMAFDASAIKPQPDPHQRTTCDMQTALYCQEHRIPIWLAPHEERWLSLLPTHKVSSLYSEAAADGFRDRNELLASRSEWVLYSIS